MDANILKDAFTVASTLVQHYDDALNINTGGVALMIKPTLNMAAPKLKVIFKF